MSDIQIRNKLSATHEGRDSRLYKLTAGKLRFPADLDAPPADPGSLWAAEWWGLEKSGLFLKLDKPTRSRALAACNRGLLNEAYFIEKSGIAYSAKMMLLAETTDVAQLYAHIAADEASHLAWIEPRIAAGDKIRPRGYFLLFLSELIEEYRPEMLVYLVQVILEGWGLNHYKRLMKNCLDPTLTEVFRHILQDEALHHRSGNLLFDAKRFSAQDFASLADAMKRYADLVRVGPLSAIASLDRAVGGMSHNDVVETLSALEHAAESRRKLELLESLMSRPGMEAILSTMHEADYFTPYGIEDAARYYLAHR